VFLGEMIIDAKLAYDKPVKDLCGTCTLCIDECPTRAILPGRIVDAGKCISYHTIENKEYIPEDLGSSFYNRVFGCDICQDVCPWNRKAPVHKTDDFRPSEKLLKMNREEWYNMTEEEFNEIFEGSAVKRAGYSGLKRNLEFLAKHDPSF
jgi:epoxyqueuosine reductase